MSQVLQQCQKQASELKQYLRHDDLPRFKEGMYDLWDLFDANQELPLAELTQIGEIICNLLCEKGVYHSDRMDFINLSGCVNDARDLAVQFPHSKSVTLNFLELLTGLFGIKFQFREFEYLDEYVPEVLELSQRFSDDEPLAVASAICIANLLNLCPYGEVGLSMILKLLERLDALWARYPENGDICFAHMQSVLLFCCVMKGHKRQEIYAEYLKKLSTLMKADAHKISDAQIDFLKAEIRRQELPI